MCPFSLPIGHSRMGNGHIECSRELRRRQPARRLVGTAGVILPRTVISRRHAPQQDGAYLLPRICRALIPYPAHLSNQGAAVPGFFLPLRRRRTLLRRGGPCLVVTGRPTVKLRPVHPEMPAGQHRVFLPAGRMPGGFSEVPARHPRPPLRLLRKSRTPQRLRLLCLRPSGTFLVLVSLLKFGLHFHYVIRNPFRLHFEMLYLGSPVQGSVTLYTVCQNVAHSTINFSCGKCTLVRGILRLISPQG